MMLMMQRMRHEVMEMLDLNKTAIKEVLVMMHRCRIPKCHVGTKYPYASRVAIPLVQMQ